MVGWTDGQTDEHRVRRADRQTGRQKHVQVRVDESVSCQHIRIGSCHVGR